MALYDRPFHRVTADCTGSIVPRTHWARYLAEGYGHRDAGTNLRVGMRIANTPAGLPRKKRDDPPPSL